jgi:hypothetical protein
LRCFVDEKTVFIDGMHIKASVNKRKSARKSVPVQAKKHRTEQYSARREKYEIDWN